MAPAATLVLLGAYALTGTTSALGDTHANCVIFDQQGNITGFTPSCSETVHVTSPPRFFPASTCTGAPGTVELDDSHSVFHININGAGDAWFTGTDGGPASFTPNNPSDASGQGTWTSWFGTKLNNQSTVNGDTRTIRLSMSDGTSFVFHENSHATLTPNGVTLQHDNVVVTCG
jgi:hypothetical protein